MHKARALQCTTQILIFSTEISSTWRNVQCGHFSRWWKRFWGFQSSQSYNFILIGFYPKRISIKIYPWWLLKIKPHSWPAELFLTVLQISVEIVRSILTLVYLWCKMFYSTSLLKLFIVKLIYFKLMTGFLEFRNNRKSARFLSAFQTSKYKTLVVLSICCRVPNLCDEYILQLFEINQNLFQLLTFSPSIPRKTRILKWQFVANVITKIWGCF